MMVAVGWNGLPDGFGLGALATVLLGLAALSLLRRPAVQQKPVPVRSRRRA